VGPDDHERYARPVSGPVASPVQAAKASRVPWSTRAPHPGWCL